MSFQANRILTIVDYLYDFQVNILKGIHRALDQEGWSSLTFVGRDLHPSDVTYQKANDLYSLIRPERFSGMLYSAASLGNSTTETELQAFALQFGNLPAVCISRPIGDLPAVLVDNASGMRELVTHLIVQLGYRKFVFIQGMQGNVEAELRERVVRETLQEHGLEIKPQHVLPGEFFGPKAAQELNRLLQHDRDFEVVVCANDEMALGALRTFREWGIHVPSEMAVVGFDDIEDARYTSPPLTTVQQPVVGAGEKAVELLLKKIRGGEVPETTLLPASLVVRKSCGALAVSLPSTTTAVQVPLDLQQAFDLALQDPDRTLQFLQVWRKTMAQQGHARDVLQSMLLTLQQARADRNGPDVQRLVFQALDLLASEIQASGSGRYFGLSRTNQVSTRLELSLTSHTKLQTLQQDIPRYMQFLGVERYAVVRYLQSGPQIHPESCLLSASWKGGGKEHFPSCDLLPPSMQTELAKGHLLVLPLFLNDLHHGLLVFEKPTDDHFNVEHLRYTLSTALHHVHAALVQQAYTEQLEQQVRERTRALENEIAVRLRAEKALRMANQELQQSALTDALTGIFNRAALDTYLQREWVNHQTQEQPLSVLLCDVDFFKQYNDLYGHLQGDECLKRIARTLDRSGRNQSDFTARYGGEEFVMVLPHTDLQGARIVAERLCAAIEALQIPHQGSKVGPHVTLSIGVSSVVPSSALNPDQVLEQADQALYQSKQTGRNRFTVYGSGAGSQ